MNCNTCGQPVLNNRIYCESCIRRKSAIAMRPRQIEFLQRMKAGELEVKLTVAERVKHVALLTVDSTWCGRTIDSRNRKIFITWPQLEKQVTCKVCLEAVQSAAKEVPAA